MATIFTHIMDGLSQMVRKAQGKVKPKEERQNQNEPKLTSKVGKSGVPYFDMESQSTRRALTQYAQKIHSSN